METRKANKIDENVKDTKTGQTEQMRVDNVFDDYANMSDAEIARLRKKREARASFSGKVLNTFVPPEFKRPNLHYEWIVYDPIVIDQKIKNGWVVVQNEELSRLKGCSTTSQVIIPSGMNNKHGEPEQLILMALHKVLYDADVQAKKQKIIDFNNNIDTGKSIVDDKGEQITENLEFKSKEVSIQ